MDSIVKDFGIQPILLAAQVVNFLVLLFLLKRFLYRPILKVLDDRKKIVSKSLKDASEIESRLQKTIEDQDKLIAKSAKEASDIIEAATRSADQIIASANDKARLDLEEMTDRAKQQLEVERQKLSLEVRSEVADLISLSFEKIVGKSLSKKDQEDLLKKSVKDI